MKDKSILNLIELLQNKIGKENLYIVNHWEADNCAIGFTNALKKNLVYISTFNKKANEYYVELETSPNIYGDEYESIATFDTLGFDDLEKTLKEHLQFN